MRLSIRAVLVLLPLPAVLAVAPAPAGAVPGEVVISEFRFRGPSGASDEFVEIYNRSAAPVVIGGWALRGSNNSGTTAIRATVPAGTTLGPGCRFLFGNSVAYSGTVPANQVFSTGITDDGGIALTRPDASIADQVGLSAGSAYGEGTRLASLGTTNVNQGYERKPGGAGGSGQDTDDNAADFAVRAPSDPQNLATGCYTEPPTPAGASTWGALKSVYR